MAFRDLAPSVMSGMPGDLARAAAQRSLLALHGKHPSHAGRKDSLMTHTPTDYLAIVRTAVAESVGVDENEVEPTATLLGDLGAESIDLLDALFRIERLSGVKLQATDIADLVQGELTDEEFEGSDGLVTAAGLDQLRKVFPSIDKAEMEGKLAGDDVMTLVTVQDLASMVAQRAGGAADAH